MSYTADQQSTHEAAPYIIQCDDTFYKISKYYSIDFDDLLEANPDRDPDNLVVGDVLCIPLSCQKVRCHTGSETYTIKEMDSIYKLAQKFNISANALLKANARINPDALLPGQTICIPKPNSCYTNDCYGISFVYPARWAKIDELHYEGLDGFFRIIAINSDLSLEDLGNTEAHHKLKPYGSNPEVRITTIAGCEACIVLPSQDQPMEMKKQAALIIKFPVCSKNGKSDYTHVFIWVDLQHINEIKNSVKLSNW